MQTPKKDLPVQKLKQLRELFDRAQTLDPAARRHFVGEACGDDAELRVALETLLEAEQRGPAWLDQSLAPAHIAQSADATWPDGREVGPYRIGRQLGHGGMATVFLAERQIGRTRQAVALKLIRPNLLTNDQVLRRFEHEREILASLDHPNIARFLDVGTTSEGEPYLVMEYVEGEPIDICCSRRNLGIADRLALFLHACEAVEYAHSRGVIHRDLKPGNILVTAGGVLKLLDFGIAKALRQDEQIASTAMTQSGFMPMTLEYASPEQIRGGSVATGTDVYSLGVLLYQLLTDSHPWRSGSSPMHAVARAICEDLPVSPSERRSGLSRDLDSIVLKAMRKEAEWRYTSAAELAEDVRRHLRGERVVAREDTFRYRGERLLRRLLHPTDSPFHTQGLMLVTSGMLGMWFLLERHQIAQGQKLLANYGRNGVLLALWFLWALFEARRMIRSGRFSALDRQSWTVFSVITVVLGIVTTLADARGLTTPEPLAILWTAGLAIGLLIVGLQANQVLTAGGIVLFGSAIAAILAPQWLYLWLAGGMAAGMIGPGLILTSWRRPKQECPPDEGGHSEPPLS